MPENIKILIEIQSTFFKNYLNFRLVCLSMNFLCSLFSSQSQSGSEISLNSSDFKAEAWHEIIFQCPLDFLMHFRLWKGWHGFWNLGLTHSWERISCRVNFRKMVSLRPEVALNSILAILAKRSSVILPLSIKKACLQLGSGSTVMSSLKWQKYGSFCSFDNYIAFINIPTNSYRLTCKLTIAHCM